MNLEDILNETPQQTSQRERVARLDAMVVAGERADERIAQSIRHLQRDVLQAVERCQRQVDNARRDRDNLPEARKRWVRESRVHKKMKQGFTRDVATEAVAIEYASVPGAFSIEDIQALLAAIGARDAEATTRKAVCHNVACGLDRLRVVVAQFDIDPPTISTEIE